MVPDYGRGLSLLQELAAEDPDNAAFYYFQLLLKALARPQEEFDEVAAHLIAAKRFGVVLLGLSAGRARLHGAEREQVFSRNLSRRDAPGSRLWKSLGNHP